MQSWCHLHPLQLLPFPSFSSSPPHLQFQTKSHSKTPRFHLSCSSSPPQLVKEGKLGPRAEYKPNWLDDFFLKSFRKKLVEEVGWDSEKDGYDGLIELVHGLILGRTNHQASQAAIRILRSLFPPFLLELYRMLITPIAGGRLAAIMVARVTVLTCQWLMGPSSVNSVNLPDGSSCQSGVFVERCKYLEESKCVGVCVNTCKLPTQFSFGVVPPPSENDSALKEACLEICPNAPRRREAISSMWTAKQCPRA